MDQFCALATALGFAFANDGAGRFTAASGIIPPATGANAFDLEVADFNGDGRRDLFVASRGRPDRLLLGR